MIGVAASSQELELAEEFFQLFKTPWEPVSSGRRYRVALVTPNGGDEVDADLVIVYGSAEIEFDRVRRVPVTRLSGPIDVQDGHGRFPIYRELARFGVPATPGALCCEGQPVEYRWRSGGRTVRRIGYDLFEELRFLLAKGQPTRYAATPTLELHIDLLRRTLIDQCVPFAEVLPRPNGHDFIACLTHDIDFCGIRRHRFDRTLAGFVARASIGTALGVARRRRTVGDLVRNCEALVRLPLVFLGLAPDLWRPFRDYAHADGSRPSTFFLLPFRDRPGAAPDGSTNRHRAAAYQASEIRSELATAAKRGAELGVHGIDAWRDEASGRAEIAALAGADRTRRVGVRMHWLYFDARSPQALEAAGFAYDSTCGYNDAVGFRAGTAQVFQLPGSRLLELPLTIMDSALFYPARMNLREHDAAAICHDVVEHATRFGGSVVINWHDRSLAPERLWGRFYERLLAEIEDGHRVWFATAGQAVEWFGWRRSIRFRTTSTCNHITIHAPHRAAAPAGVLRVSRLETAHYRTRDIPFDGADALTVTL
jgi:hypothetical protein